MAVAMFGMLKNAASRPLNMAIARHCSPPSDQMLLYWPAGDRQRRVRRASGATQRQWHHAQPTRATPCVYRSGQQRATQGRGGFPNARATHRYTCRPRRAPAPRPPSAPEQQPPPRPADADASTSAAQRLKRPAVVAKRTRTQPASRAPSLRAARRRRGAGGRDRDRAQRCGSNAAQAAPPLPQQGCAS